MIQLGYESWKKKYIIVAYRPFTSDSSNKNKKAIDQLMLAKINLKTGKVTPVSDPNGSVLKSLKPVESFL